MNDFVEVKQVANHSVSSERPKAIDLRSFAMG
jgi:hypothetical protein